MDIFLPVVYALFGLFLLRKYPWFKPDGIPLAWVSWAFILKILGGLSIWAVYTYHYSYRETSDAFRYFDDAMLIYGTLQDDPAIYFRFLFGINLEDPSLEPILAKLRGWHSSYTYGIANDNPTVIRANAVVAIFSLGNYHVHTVFMAFFSLVGLTGFYAFLAPLAGKHKKWLYACSMLLPTIWFWGSGVLKEPLLILFTGLMLWSLSRLRMFSAKSALLLLVSCLGLFFMKPYTIMAMIPGLFTYAVLILSGSSRAWLKAGMVHLFFFLAASNSSVFFRGGDFLHIINRKKTDFYNVAEAYNAGSTIEIPESNSLPDLLIHSPGALVRAYLRPHLFEVKSVFYLANALENLALTLLLLGTVLALFYFSAQPTPEFLLSLSFIIVLGVLIGSVVPVMGAIVRYKLPALPFIAACGIAGWSAFLLSLRSGQKPMSFFRRG
jgi:hypothetical protein